MIEHTENAEFGSMSVTWPTSSWERPLTPSGRPFPYRKSRDVSPNRLSTSRDGDAEPFLTSVYMEETLERPSTPPTGPPPSTYTVQYIGLAKGELGVLSKKEVCMPVRAMHHLAKPCNCLAHPLL